jgi:hypothetical protein
VHPAVPPYDALVGLRIGHFAGELRTFSSTLDDGEERTAIDETLIGIGAHFRSLDPTKLVAAGQFVLDAIDRALAAFAVDQQSERRRRGAIALTALRRNLFPHVAPFAGTPAGCPNDR